MPHADRAKALAVLNTAINSARFEAARREAFAADHPDIERAQEHVRRLRADVAALEALRDFAQNAGPPLGVASPDDSP
jgi:hypothetical protein